LVKGAHSLHPLELAREVDLERRCRSSGQPDGAPTLLGLRLIKDVDIIPAAKSAAHSEYAAFEVHIFPLEGQELALTHPCVECQDVESL
jgi:hypothetical protein